MININVQNFFSHVGSSWGPRGVTGPHPFFGKKLKLLKKATKVSYFYKIPILSLWPLKNNFLQTCWVTQRGVAGQHPFFGQKLKLLKKATKVSYFSKSLMHRVAYDLEKSYFFGMLGLPEGRGRTKPIFGEKLNFGYLSKWFFHTSSVWPFFKFSFASDSLFDL